MKLIQSDHWRLWSDPDKGVQWLAGEVNRSGKWHAVLPDCRNAPSNSGKQPGSRAGQNESAPLAAASFHMIPYSNRIRDALFRFEQQSVQLNQREKHAIHGALRALPWNTLYHDQSCLKCEIDTRQRQNINWPWPMHASIEQRIEDNILHSEISITNLGSSAMPAGTGWHPYFVREIAGVHPSLTLPVQGVFPDANGDCLPDGPAENLPHELDFRHRRLLDASQRIDACLSGLDGDCVLEWQDTGIKLTLRASDNCRYLILFNPDMPHFAVEPVTNANDAFNLQSQGIESGAQILQSGETLVASLQLISGDTE